MVRAFLGRLQARKSTHPTHTQTLSTLRRRRESRGMVKAFLEASARGHQYAVDHPHEAADMLVDLAREECPDLPDMLEREMVRESMDVLAEVGAAGLLGLVVFLGVSFHFGACSLGALKSGRCAREHGRAGRGAEGACRRWVTWARVV